MAVDTRNRRASVLGVGQPFAVVFPNPDESLDNAGDRQQIAYSYAFEGVALVRVTGMRLFKVLPS